MRILLLAAAALAAASSSPATFAQQASYADLRAREVKALSAAQIGDLREGRGMGLALAAELNGAPGPMHVIELAREIGLTAAQLEHMQSIMMRMRSQAKALGEEVVQAEIALDRAFQRATLDAAAVQRMTEELGVLGGRLRAVHLQAHVETKSVLTAAQIASYNRARGYAPEPSGAPQSPPSHGSHGHGG
jgi:Spy/CpxP family protein refolding chaperone